LEKEERKSKTDMLESIGKQSGKSVESVLKKKEVGYFLPHPLYSKVASGNFVVINEYDKADDDD